MNNTPTNIVIKPQANNRGVMRIHNNIKKIRKDMGLSQSELATELCVSQGLVSNYERQINTVSPEVANKLISVALDRGVTINFNDIYKS